MNRKDFRAAGIGVAAGVATLTAILAWDDVDPPRAVRTALERRRLSPAERQEWQTLQDQHAARAAEQSRKYQQDKQDRLAKFQPAMLTVAQVDRLDQLTVRELLAEIDAAQAAHKAQWILPWIEREHVTLEHWSDQLTALTEYFDQLRWGRFGKKFRKLSAFDQIRMDCAYSWVHDYERSRPSPSITEELAANEAATMRAEQVSDLHSPADDYPAFEGPAAAAFGVDVPVPADEAAQLDEEDQVAAEDLYMAGWEAEALQSALFRLYDQVNRPDIVWTEDGPEYGDTYDDGADPALAAAVEKAEKRLNEHLVEHRAELAGLDHWKSYYAEIDQEKETGDE